MKVIRHYFIGISFFALLFITGGCIGESEWAGNGDGNPVPLIIRAMAEDFDNLPSTVHTDNTPKTRTPTEDGNATIFGKGDAIGIFALKDGAIVDNISNTKLTYSNVGGIDYWTSSTGIALYYYEDVSYIAYYPYKEGITIDAAKTTDEIIASLADNDKLQPATDQSNTDGSACTGSDLMVAYGTPTNGSTVAGKILTLDFKHRFSLLVLIPRVFVKCYAPADAGFVYRENAKVPATDKDANTVILNNVTAYKMSDGSYRAIVKPTIDVSTINGNYLAKDDRTINYESASYSNGFIAGNCYTLKVDSPLPGDGSVERALAPGDFVFHGTSDIEVYPGDGLLVDGKIPDYADAVGVVVTCDPSRMTDAECNNNGWNHAYVMGLYQEANCRWGPTIAETVIPSVARGSMGNTNGAQFDMNGYTESEAILNTYKNTISNYPVFYKLNTYRTNNPVPDGVNNKRSQWFIGSVGQWFDVLLNLGGRSPWTFKNNASDDWTDTTNARGEIWNAINGHLQKVNKPLTNITSNTSVYYWCSSQNGSGAWRIGFGNSVVTTNDISLRAIPKDNSPGQRAFRPFFAF